MRILIVGYYSHSWHEVAFERAFRDLGHEVSRFAFKSYMATRFSYPQTRFLLGPLIRLINRDFAKLAVTSHPDAILFYRSLLISPDTIVSIRKRLPRTVFVSYQNDNMFGALRKKTYWRFFLRSIPLYDVNLVYRHSDIEHYSEFNARNLYLLRSHFLPWLHRPLPDVNKDIDIGLYGHCENDRRIDDVSTLMQNLEASYCIRGSRWKEFGKLRPWRTMETSEVQNEDYVHFINRSKILLAFLSTLNADTYTRRCFEIPACGGFMLCQRTDDLLALFQEDKEAVFFGSASELVDKAKFYLQSQASSERIAQAGRERCMRSGYDIYSRAKEILHQVRKVLS